jgi:hypothetical protein
MVVLRDDGDTITYAPLRIAFALTLDTIVEFVIHLLP